MTQVPAIIQARMGSSRLPGKVLQVVLGKPLLQFLLERLEHCPCVSRVIVATSISPLDDAVADFCAQRGVACVRGSLTNVAERFGQAIEQFPCEAFLRVNGDSPLLDQRLIERGMALFAGSDCDVVTNIMPRTFPRGQSVEVVRSTSFQRARGLMSEAGDFEHVTQVFYRHRDQFRIINFTADENFTDVHLAVDAPEDLARFEAIVASMVRPHWEYALAESVEIARRLSREVEPH